MRHRRQPVGMQGIDNARNGKGDVHLPRSSGKLCMNTNFCGMMGRLEFP